MEFEFLIFVVCCDVCVVVCGWCCVDGVVFVLVELCVVVVGVDVGYELCDGWVVCWDGCDYGWLELNGWCVGFVVVIIGFCEKVVEC